MNTYNETINNRPTKIVCVAEINPYQRDRVSIDSLISQLNDIKANNKEGYKQIWVEVNYNQGDEDNLDYTAITIVGEREFTDREWIYELESIKDRTVRAKQNFEERKKYYEYNKDKVLLTAVENRVKSLKNIV